VAHGCGVFQADVSRLAAVLLPVQGVRSDHPQGSTSSPARRNGGASMTKTVNSARTVEAVRLVLEQPGITRDQLQERMNISKGTAGQYLWMAASVGAIRWDRSRRGWFVAEQAPPEAAEVMHKVMQRRRVNSVWALGVGL
jgi:predicted DNA-binding protein (UPF0251 family)